MNTTFTFNLNIKIGLYAAIIILIITSTGACETWTETAMIASFINEYNMLCFHEVPSPLPGHLMA